jgi:hypothetical protein
VSQQAQTTPGPIFRWGSSSIPVPDIPFESRDLKRISRSKTARPFVNSCLSLERGDDD